MGDIISKASATLRGKRHLPHCTRKETQSQMLNNIQDHPANESGCEPGSETTLRAKCVPA